jgi:hypothetical protein
MSYSRELELARAELRRCKYWRISSLRRVAGLEKAFADARITTDGTTFRVAEEFALAKRQADLAAADVAGYRRIINRLTGARA